MDVQMPGMSGFDVTRAIRKEATQEWFPIVFLTALAETAEIVSGIEAGGDDYLTKPVAPVVLKAKLRAMERIATMRRRLMKAAAELNEAKAKLEQLANVDGLCNLANRRVFNETLEIEILRAARIEMPLSLVMIDVDHFKIYNDRLGHQAGDECLRQVAAALKETIRRPSDLAARYGGEEFVLVLPETDHAGAIFVAEAVRTRLRARAIPHPREPGALVTVSLGVATSFAGTIDGAELIKKADGALYRAKELGRDRVEGAPREADGEPPALAVHA